MTYLKPSHSSELAIAPEGLPTLIEKAFTLVALFFYTGALACFIGDDNPLRIYRELCAYAGFAIALVLLLLNFRTVVTILSRDLWLCLFVVIMLLSPLWADQPGDIAYNLIPLLRVTVFGIYFGTRYTLREQVQMVAWIFGAGAIFSVLVAVFLPFYGIMGYGVITNSQQIVHQGVWRGAYIHRNYLSAMMAIGILSYIYCVVRFSWFRWLGLFFMGVSSFLIVISAAKSAPTMLAIVLLLIPLYRALRWNYHVAVPFFVLLILLVGGGGVLLLSNAETILGWLGRDITLTGRTDYWSLMVEKAWERPWLGYGYDGLWEGDWKGEIADVWQLLQDGDEPPHPHNGFLFVWLNVGLVGLFVFVTHWFINFLRSVQWLKAVPTAEGLVPIAYLSLFVLMNITETMLTQADIVWLLYVTTSLALVSESPEQPESWAGELMG